MPHTWLTACTEGIKVSHTHRDISGGRFVWVKQRRPVAKLVLRGANAFFWLARTPVRAVVQPKEWQQREVTTYLGLYEEENFLAEAIGEQCVRQDEFPGVNLTRHLDGGTLTPTMTAAAGRELRRAHQWRSPLLGGARWSHGDAHAGNFIYDPKRERVRIIDFDLRHRTGVSDDTRHVDDVLAFLQDVLGRICPERWLPCAEAFLEGYDRPELLPQLLKALRLPAPGFRRLWWMVRCSFLSSHEVRRRVEELRNGRVLESAREEVQVARRGLVPA